MKRLGQKLGSLTRSSKRKRGLTWFLLKIHTPWATAGVVSIALLCGFLFNAVQPSLLLDYAQPSTTQSESLAVSTPETLPDTDIEHAKPLPNQPTPKPTEQVAATNHRACNRTALRNMFAAEDERHKAALESLDGIRLWSRLSGTIRKQITAENDRHAQETKRLQQIYNQAIRNC